MHSAKPLLFASLLLACACHDLTPRQQAKLDRFECQARALAQVVEPTLDAAEVLKDLYTGEAELASVIGAVGATRAEFEQLLADLESCGTIVERAPAPEPAEPAALRVSW